MSTSGSPEGNGACDESLEKSLFASLEEYEQYLDRELEFSFRDTCAHGNTEAAWAEQWSHDGTVTQTLDTRSGPTYTAAGLRKPQRQSKRDRSEKGRKQTIPPSQNDQDRPTLSYDDLKWAEMHGLTEEDIFDNFNSTKMVILNGRNPFKGKHFRRLIRALHGDSADEVIAQFAQESHTVGRGRYSTANPFEPDGENFDGATLPRSDNKVRKIAAVTASKRKKRSLPGEEEPASPHKKRCSNTAGGTSSNTHNQSLQGQEEGPASLDKNQRPSAVDWKKNKSPAKALAAGIPCGGKKRLLQQVEWTSSPKKKRALIMNSAGEDIGNA